MKRLRSRFLLGALCLMLLVLVLLTADRFCYELALPVEIDLQGGVATLHVGSQSVPLGPVGTPAVLQFAAHDPVVHEYQLDGSDSTNNFTLDSTYLHHLASSPYYRFQAWMRDLDGTSRWRDLQVWVDGQLVAGTDWLPEGASVSLPAFTSLSIHVRLQRPETPMMLNLIGPDGTPLSITLDRNDRQIAVTRLTRGARASGPPAKTFFPLDPAPFAAMIMDFLVRTLLWALLVLGVVLVGEVAYRSNHKAGSFFKLVMASSMPSHPPLGLVSVLSTYLNRIGLCIVALGEYHKRQRGKRARKRPLFSYFLAESYTFLPQPACCCSIALYPHDPC